MEKREKRKIGKRWMFGALIVIGVGVAMSDLAYNRMKGDTAPAAIPCAVANQSGQPVEFRFGEAQTLRAEPGTTSTARDTGQCSYAARKGNDPVALEWRVADAQGAEGKWRQTTLAAKRPDDPAMLLLRFTEDKKAEARFADASEVPSAPANLDPALWTRGDWTKG